jgi:acyl-CoA synthetase (AMP-forming)/AMP-acid ligase II
VGGRIIFEPCFAFPYKVVQRIVEERVTGIPIVPTLAAMILSLKDLSRFDFRSLRYITNAAAALPLSYIRKLREHFPHAKLFSMYGLTECTRVCYLPPAEIARRPASVGVPMPNCEVLVVDEEGRRLGPNEVGELVVRGANVNQGYWALPEETAMRFRSGGSRGDAFLYTGDLFRQDEEGFLYFVARKDDLIKTRGERVSPKEIEDVIFEIEGIAQAAVVGVPDEVFGQAVKAFVALSADSHLQKSDILNHCKKNLELFMVPKFIELRDCLPVNGNGKIDKKMLN